VTKSRGIRAPRKSWQPHELQLLRLHYADSRTADLAEALGLPESTVYRKANDLGLLKTDAYLASEKSGRIQRGKQDPRMAATHFQPGQSPWNKGQHYDAGGRSVETRFKPGRPAHESPRYLPIGSLRINKDGVLERKVTDDQALAPARRWVAVHRLVWEAANGPIPADHAVVFLPGRRSTEVNKITLDAVELVSRQELMRRNSVHTRLPPELAQLAQLRGALTRQINRRAKEARQLLEESTPS